MNQDNKGQPQQGDQNNKPGQQGQQPGQKPRTADAAAVPEAWPGREQELNSREPRHSAGFSVSGFPDVDLSRTTKGISVIAPQIALVEDGPGSYRFTFASARGEMSGRVTVGIEGPPDKRSGADREQAAKNQILALSREFAEACGE